MGSNNINSNLNSFFTKVLQQGIADKNKDGKVDAQEQKEHEELLGFSKEVNDLYSLTSEGKWEEALKKAEEIDLTAKKELTGEMAELDKNKDGKVDLSEIEGHEMYGGLTNIFTDATTTFSMDDFENFAQMLDIDGDGEVTNNEKTVFNSLTSAVKAGNFEGVQLTDTDKTNVMEALQQTVLGNELEARLVEAMNAFKSVAQIQVGMAKPENVTDNINMPLTPPPIEDLQIDVPPQKPVQVVLPPTTEVVSGGNSYQIAFFDTLDAETQAKIMQMLEMNVSGLAYSRWILPEISADGSTVTLVPVNDQSGTNDYHLASLTATFDSSGSIVSTTKREECVKIITQSGWETFTIETKTFGNSSEEVTARDKEGNLKSKTVRFFDANKVLAGNFSMTPKDGHIDKLEQLSYSINADGVLGINANGMNIAGLNGLIQDLSVSGIPVKEIIIYGDNNTFTDAVGNDVVVKVVGNNNEINGGDGKDNITVIGHNNTIDGGKGADTITMINGRDNVVKPMVGDDTVVNITKNVGSLDFVNNILGQDINPENYNITYDDQGRIISVTPKIRIAQPYYTNADNKLEENYVSPYPMVGGSYSFSYDDENGEVSVTTQRLAGQKIQDCTKTYDYDGKLLRETRKDFTMEETTIYNDDGSKVVTKISWTGIKTVKTIDPNGNIVGYEPALAPEQQGSVEFLLKAYGKELGADIDSLEDLTNVIYDDQGRIIDFEVANMVYTSKPDYSVSYNDEDGTMTVASTSFDEKFGWEVTTEKTYDKAGVCIGTMTGPWPVEPPKVGTVEFLDNILGSDYNLKNYKPEYDDQGRIVKLVKIWPEGMVSTVSGNIYIEYDDENQEIMVHVNGAMTGSAYIDKFYNYDGKLIREYMTNLHTLGPGGWEEITEYNDDGSKVVTITYADGGKTITKTDTQKDVMLYTVKDLCDEKYPALEGDAICFEAPPSSNEFPNPQAVMPLEVGSTVTIFKDGFVMVEDTNKVQLLYDQYGDLYTGMYENRYYENGVFQYALGYVAPPTVEPEPIPAPVPPYLSEQEQIMANRWAQRQEFYGDITFNSNLFSSDAETEAVLQPIENHLEGDNWYGNDISDDLLSWDRYETDEE